MEREKEIRTEADRRMGGLEEPRVAKTLREGLCVRCTIHSRLDILSSVCRALCEPDPGPSPQACSHSSFPEGLASALCISQLWLQHCCVTPTPGTRLVALPGPGL